MQKKISVLIPVYNEAGNIHTIHKAIHDFFLEMPQYSHEQIFIDDGSSDLSLLQIRKLCTEYKNVAYISFSRNFGKDNALIAGFSNSMGDAVITIDADMQHPPSLMKQLLLEWESGYEMVYCYREKKNEHSGFKSQFFSSMFYKVINALSDIKMQEGVSDFRIMDRKVVDAINSMQEDHPFVRGMVHWVGFAQKGIPYIAEGRHTGDSSYKMKSLVKLALNGITSFSTKPLNIAIYLGFFFSMVSMLFIPYAIVSKIYGVAISGWASVIVTIAFFGGLNLMILGILGIYLGKSFMQGKKRPHYIISETNVDRMYEIDHSRKELFENRSWTNIN
ncbi:MAG: glycosyltransferase family 2 protein [Ferruginibacter sp.]